MAMAAAVVATGQAKNGREKVCIAVGCGRTIPPGTDMYRRRDGVCVLHAKYGRLFVSDDNLCLWCSSEKSALPVEHFKGGYSRCDDCQKLRRKSTDAVSSPLCYRSYPSNPLPKKRPKTPRSDRNGETLVPLGSYEYPPDEAAVLDMLRSKIPYLQAISSVTRINEVAISESLPAFGGLTGDFAVNADDKLLPLLLDIDDDTGA